MDRTIRVDLVEGDEAFADLRAAWDALWARARRSSVFMTWEWQSLWWKHHGQGAQLRTWVAHRGGDVVGIAPYYIERRRMLRVVPLRVMRSVGTGGDTAPDDLDPLLAPECESEVAAALATAIVDRTEGWNVMLVADLTEDSPWLSAIRDVAQRNGLAVRETPPILISWLPIDTDWDGYLAKLSAKRRYAIRASRRKFEAFPQARFYFVTQASQLDAIFDRLIELHHMRWEGRAERYAFSTPRYCAFHRDIVHALFTRDMVRLYVLEVAGQAIAIYYCYRAHGTVYHFQGGFDTSFGSLNPGPGAILMGYAIESAMTEGCSAFDLLRGEYEYKRNWASRTRRTVGVEIVRPGVRTAIRRCMTDIVAPARRRVRHWLSGVRAADTAVGSV